MNSKIARRIRIGTLMVLMLMSSWFIEAATLVRTIYLTAPWGNKTGEVGRFIPQKGEESYPGGPVGFSIDPDGNVYLSDIQTHCLHIFKHDGRLLREIRFSVKKNDLVDEVDAVDPAHVALLLDFHASVPAERQQQLLLYDASGQVRQKLLLTPLGIQIPLFVQWGDHNDLFIGDNKGFQTFRITLAGRVLEKREDDRIFWLRTKGRYNYVWDNSHVAVFSPEGRKLTEYPGRVELVGVDSKGNLITIYKDDRSGEALHDVWVTGLSPDGQEMYRIHVTDKQDTNILDPSRFDEIRNGRIGPDDALYVMGDPTDDQFRIYRYEIKK